MELTERTRMQIENYENTAKVLLNQIKIDLSRLGPNDPAFTTIIQYYKDVNKLIQGFEHTRNLYINGDV